MLRLPSVLLCAALGASAACGRESQPTETAALAPSSTASELAANNDVLFPIDARPYGASLSEWADREGVWAYQQPLAVNPLLDQTGEHCAEGQEGPVWFLPRIAGPRVHSATRTCTIPAGRAILLEIGAYVNPFPCPDPNFRPAPGQSLYDFLRVDPKNFMDGVTLLEVSLDGVPLVDPMAYRVHSEELVYFTGDPSMSAVDPCITGTEQPMVSDGFFMLFKPLSPGEHVIRVYGEDVRGAEKTYVYRLTVG
jgi:hypothetical protein